MKPSQVDHTLATPGSQGQAGRFYVYAISFGAAVGGFLFGYDLAVVGGAQLLLEKYFSLDASGLGWATSSALLGCAAGPLVAGFMADRLGRKNTLIAGSLLLAVSSIGTSLPEDISTYNLFRIVGGVGVGICSIVSPMYIAEIAPARVRGALITINQVAIVLGCLVSYIVAQALLGLFSHDVAWRWMFGLECVPILFFVIYLLFVPRSPRWLAEKGRSEEALTVLTRIQGREAALRELDGMERLRDEETARFTDVFRPGVRFALLIAVTLAVLQQWTGVSVLSSYLPKIYQAAGYERISDAVWLSVVTYIFNLAVTVVALWLVDRTGRRPLLLVGSAGMVVGLLCLGLVFFLNVRGIAVLLAMLIAQAAFLVSLAPVTWIIMSEIFPTRIRGRAMGIAALSLWIACFLGVRYIPVLMEVFEAMFGTPAGVFWVFAGVCVFSYWFCWKWVPETKGRTLEEIAASWRQE